MDDPGHGSLHFKKLEGHEALWSVRIGRQYRALGRLPHLTAAPDDARPGPLVLLTSANATRWFFLIVVYGVFIPNTWQRCAVVVSAMALTPLVLTPAAAFLHGRLDPGLWSALFDMAVLLATARKRRSRRSIH